MRAGKVLSALSRVTGISAAGSLALALLAGGCVLAATAGPFQAKATQVQAMQGMLTRLPATDNAIVVSSSWQDIAAALYGPMASVVPPGVPVTELNDMTAQLHRDYTRPPIDQALRAAGWWDMTSSLSNAAPVPDRPTRYHEQVEVVSQSAGAARLRLTAGSMPGAAPPPVVNKRAGLKTFSLQVAVTRQTAAGFGLRPGSRLTFTGPQDDSGPELLQIVVNLDITGIVEPADPQALFWQTDQLLSAPLVVQTATGTYLDGAVIAGPGEAGMVQLALGWGQLSYQWVLPVDPGRLTAQPADLFRQLTELTHAFPRVTGDLAQATQELHASSGLLQPLGQFVQALSDMQDLLRILYVGLAVAGAVVLLLAARTVAARRAAELALLRGRGAAWWQLFARGALGAAVTCGPAAVLAWAAAMLLFRVPGAASPAAWWPGLATVVVAVAGPGAAAAWQHRLPRRRPARRRLRRALWVPRAVAEVTACAAAAGVIEVFRTQGGATGVFSSVAPVLVAVPAVVVVVRLYQVVMRVLARAAVRRRGLVGFLGLTRAALAGGTRALSAMTLVLLLTLAAFTGMVRSAVARGETAASWQATGADVTVTALDQSSIPAAEQRAITAVPGVQHAAAVATFPVYLPGAQVLAAVAVDPASYAALAAAAQGYSPVDPGLLTGPHGGAVPVLASPQAARLLRQPGNGTVAAPQDGVGGLRVRVAGLLSSTPALPAGGSFVVLPSSALRGSGAPQANLMLLTGPSIDMTKLRAAVGATMPGTHPVFIATRSQVLQGLQQAPAQQGTYLFIDLSLAYAAALALAVLVLELALSATERERTLARLATMGLAEGQRVRLVVTETLPAIAASALAAVASAVVLPGLVGQDINLSMFTGYQTSPTVRPDLASVLIPLAGLLAVTVIALAYEVRSGRGRGVAVTLRT